MNIRQHWAKGWALGRFADGKPFRSPVHAGSDASDADARRLLAIAIDERLAAWALRPSKRSPLGRDADYGVADIVEPVASRGFEEGAGAWAVTRNGYGSRIWDMGEGFSLDKRRGRPLEILDNPSLAG